MVLAADVADEVQMQDVIARGRKQFGTVHGVFHGAGVVEEKAFPDIPNTGRGESEMHFGPKVRGVLVLEKVLQGLQLDFCVTLSSVASVLGGVRNAAYAAANAFMDAFVQEHNRHGGTPWISVNWDFWRFSELVTQGRASLVEAAIAPEEGMEAFQRVLCARGMGQIVVSTLDVESRIRESIARRTMPGAADQANAGLPALDGSNQLERFWRSLNCRTDLSLCSRWMNR